MRDSPACSSASRLGRIVSAVFDGADHIAGLVSQQGVRALLQRPVAGQTVFADPAAVRQTAPPVMQIESADIQIVGHLSQLDDRSATRAKEDDRAAGLRTQP